jgi:hypothetical protein
MRVYVGRIALVAGIGLSLTGGSAYGYRSSSGVTPETACHAPAGSIAGRSVTVNCPIRPYECLETLEKKPEQCAKVKYFGKMQLMLTWTLGSETGSEIKAVKSDNAFITFTPPDFVVGEAAITIFQRWDTFDGSGGLTAWNELKTYEKRDPRAPTDGIVSATSLNSAVELSFEGFAEVPNLWQSGVTQYKVAFTRGRGLTAPKAPPLKCAASEANVLYTGGDSGILHENLVNGIGYTYRVCAIDAAGNVSNGSVVSAAPAPEHTPPTDCTLSINDAAESARSPVTLTLSATDESEVESMCVSNTNAVPCTKWEPYKTMKTKWKMPASSTPGGHSSVYAWFRDRYGNVTPSPADASIMIDESAPVGGRLEMTAYHRAVILKWADFSDEAGAGIAKYIVRYGAKAPKERCSGGDGGCSTGPGGSACTFTNLKNGTSQTFRVCAVDAVGNKSIGVLGVATPIGTLGPIPGDSRFAQWPLTGVQSFDDQNDGTVLQSATGLLWQRKHTSAGTAPAARASCEALKLAGLSWRLPTRIELLTVVDFAMDPSLVPINAVAFPTAQKELFWTASVVPGDAGLDDAPLLVSFRDGSVQRAWELDDKNKVTGVIKSARVRCVIDTQTH